MSRKQELARRRNFNKFRLAGFSLDEGAMTRDEWQLYRILKDTLLQNWNEQSRSLGLNPKERT